MKKSISKEENVLDALKNTIVKAAKYSIDDIIVYDAALHIITRIGFSFNEEEKVFRYSGSPLELKGTKFQYDIDNEFTFEESEIYKKICDCNSCPFEIEVCGG